MTDNKKVKVSEVVFSLPTGKGVKMTVIAEGDWSGRDMENLYEMLGHQMRTGVFDPIITRLADVGQPT